MKFALLSLFVFYSSAQMKAVLPWCTLDFLSHDGRCSTGDQATFDFPDGKIPNAEIFYLKVASKEVIAARQYFLAAPKGSDEDRAQNILKVIKRLTIEQIKNGRRDEQLLPNDSHLINRVKAVHINFLTSNHPYCTDQLGVPVIDAAMDLVSSELHVCPGVLRLPELALGFVLGHEVAHNIDDCGAILPLYKDGEELEFDTYSPREFYTQLELANGSGLISAPSVTKGNGVYAYAKVRECLVAEKGVGGSDCTFKPVGDLRNFRCGLLPWLLKAVSKRIDNLYACGKKNVGEDIADYIGATSALAYQKEKKLPQAATKQIFTLFASLACWNKELIAGDKHSPLVTRLNTVLSAKGMQKSLGCEGTNGKAYTCFSDKYLPASQSSPASPRQKGQVNR